MPTFTAIDFETANYDRSSICQVGLIRIENGIELNHHEALSDARACAKLFMIWMGKK